MILSLSPIERGGGQSPLGLGRKQVMMSGMTPRLLSLISRLTILSLCGLALYPAVHRLHARWGVPKTVEQVRRALGPDDAARISSCGSLAEAALLKFKPSLLKFKPALASWGDIGGCGAGGGGASSTAGGSKWVGRGVTGGLVDLQCMSSYTNSQGNSFASMGLRLGQSSLEKWRFGFNLPILYKVGGVTVLGMEQTAHIAGFGDVSLEIARKLGITNATVLTLTLSAPTGASEAVRQGVVLPPHLQLGSGVLGAGAELEHTWDRDWGLMIFGGTMNYGGWSNGLGDFRAPSTTGYIYAGTFWGPLVPSAGLTLFGKFIHDQQRHEDRPDDQDPLLMVIPSLGLEWSSDLLALLLSSSVSLSYNGFENVSLSLGVSSSLF